MSTNENRKYEPKISSRVNVYPSKYKDGNIKYSGQPIAAYFNVNIMADEGVKDWYNENTFMPSTEKSVGFDLRAMVDNECGFVEIQPHERYKFNTGIHIQPKEFGINGYVFSRSGLGAKQGLVVAQGVAVIDPDYTGPIVLYMLNTSNEIIVVKHGDRIAQLVFMRYELPRFNFVDTLDETDRGDG